MRSFEEEIIRRKVKGTKGKKKKKRSKIDARKKKDGATRRYGKRFRKTQPDQ